MNDLRPNSEVADGIHWIKTGYVNAYIVERDEDLILIDSGLNKKANVILGYINEELKDSSISKVLITHHHMDHTKGLYHIHQHHHPEIYSSKIDGEVISGQRKGQLPNIMILRPLLFILRPFISPRPVKELTYVEEGEMVENFKVYSLPGHTMGSLGFLQENALFSGDNGVTDKEGNVIFAPKFFTEDHQENERSLKKMSKLSFDMLLSGHGAPILEDASQRALDAVERFNL